MFVQLIINFMIACNLHESQFCLYSEYDHDELMALWPLSNTNHISEVKPSTVFYHNHDRIQSNLL